MAQSAVDDGGHDARRISVAIVGTGLAGLTTAHLLQNDTLQRYGVTLFEQVGSHNPSQRQSIGIDPPQADSLSFDSASVSIKNEKTGTAERIDLPMRAFAGGYYANLIRMYEHLSIPLHSVRFLFVFAKALSMSKSQLCEAKTPGEAGSAPGSYFVHASNLHQVPPPWPAGRGVVTHIGEILYLIICYFWYSLCCFLVPPITGRKPRSRMPDEGFSDGGETFGEYLQRTWVPRRYASHYLLPLMSVVLTCDHAELLNCPASDIVNYKRLTHGQQHYAVCGGVCQVQSALIKGIEDIRLGSRVMGIENDASGVLVRWQSTCNTDGHLETQRFDRVVLAVSPDVVRRIFSPLAKTLEKLPTKPVDSYILSPRPGSSSLIRGEGASKACAHHSEDGAESQVITIRTLFKDGISRSETLQALPGEVLVSTTPLDASIDSEARLHSASFTRTLRTTASRAVTQRIMDLDRPSAWSKKTDGSSPAGWVNGEGGVWLTGSWCWDGMVLLEGCVVSAMRVARDFGVGIPWQDDLVRC